jgi:RNA polymerase sigma-70 factor (ECF subfamily)
VQPSTVLSATPEVTADMESDDALAAVAATDRGAFETLYLRHRSELFRYARARTGDADAAADIVSTTFERALGSIGRYRPLGGGFRAWLFRIARNEVVDASRRRQTVARHAPAMQVAEATEAGPEDDLIRLEAMGQIRALVARLPDTQRDAVLLRYAGGLSTREIALTLGRSEGATQKLITRALAALKEAYRATDR